MAVDPDRHADERAVVELVAEFAVPEAADEATSAAPSDAPLSVDEAVEHREWGAGTVMSVEDDRATIFFESEGYKVLSFAALESGVLTEREPVSA